MTKEIKFTGSEDWNEVYAARPNKYLGEVVEVQVVGRRCVYVNNYRICGGKPYYSEFIPSHEFTTTLGDVLAAFKESDILAAIKERKSQDEYFATYRAARDAQKEPVE